MDVAIESTRVFVSALVQIGRASDLGTFFSFVALVVLSPAALAALRFKL